MTLYADIQGERLDAFLARSMPELSRSTAQKLLEEGCVQRNGSPGGKNDRLGVGDRIEVYSAGNPQSPDYECGIWVPVQGMDEDANEYEAAEIVSTMMVTGIL